MNQKTKVILILLLIIFAGYLCWLFIFKTGNQGIANQFTAEKKIEILKQIQSDPADLIPKEEKREILEQIGGKTTGTTTTLSEEEKLKLLNQIQ